MPSDDMNDFLQHYEAALVVLEDFPDNRKAQHQAVLALARMGSLDYAQNEFKRYGLDKVRHHEDIMALGGRLSKDLYVVSSGPSALEQARNSAEKYEAAFKDTGGYYSGVNAATMALLADMPAEMVQARSRDVAERLPETKNVSKTEHYFIEATRADCFLLQGDIGKAAECLKGAVEFDPLNYAAHASTLKQFRMILDKRNAGTSWLEAFTPPSPLHYAGHIWDANILCEEEEILKIQISDAIQSNDIAYGYGALAAGADILIAETLLEEGAELHVFLPCSLERFAEKSVMPFGKDWSPRFEACVKAASSVNLYDAADLWPDITLNRAMGRITIGAAMMRGEHFGVLAKQLLLLDHREPDTFTSDHAEDWPLGTDLQIIMPMIKARKSLGGNASAAKPEIHESFVCISGLDKKTFDDINEALQTARQLLAELPNSHIGLGMAALEANALPLSKLGPLPYGLYVSEPMAAYLTWNNSDEFFIKYAGQLNAGEQVKHIFRVSFT